MTKAFRHGQILKLIQRGRMYTQEELARGLMELDAILDADFRLPPEPPAAKLNHP